MKINIKREGGFMGLTAKALIDFTKISEEERAKMETVIEEVTTPKPEKKVAERGISPMRDTFSYSFSYKKDGKTVKYTFNDMTAPPQLVELFEKYVAY
jgi:hypothetical protein